MTPRFAATLLTCLVGMLLPLMPSVREAEEHTIDARFRLRGPLPENGRVLVVAIDDTTEREWRDIPKAMWAGELAKIVTKLHEAGAKRIGLDFVVSVDPDNYLSSKGIDEQPNAELDQAIIESGERVLLGTSQAEDVVAPLNVPDRLVSVNRNVMTIGVVRQLPRYDRSFDPPALGMAAALAEEAGNRTHPIQINYSGRRPSVISVSDLLHDRVPLDIAEGAIVLVGETYRSTADQHRTPFETSTPGVFIHAEAVKTLLDRNELRLLPDWMTSLMVLAASVLGAGLASRKWIGGYYAVAGGAAVAWALMCWGAFNQMHVVLPFLAPVFMLLVVSPGAMYSARAIEEFREKTYVRTRWGQLVGESTLRRLESNRRGGLGAWGTFHSALLFLDVADFSSITREVGPGETVTLLNKLFSAVIERVENGGGEILNFMGDGLAAKWDLDQNADAEQLLRVLNVALSILDGIDELRNQGALGVHPINVRIGLSSGETTLALIGSEDRQQMTVYGEAVNLAARLEALGKDRAVQSRLIVSEAFADVLAQSGRSFVQGETHLKGWNTKVPFWYLAEHQSP